MNQQFYFIVTLIVMTVMGIPASEDLYTQFSREFDKMSNYAENKMKSRTLPSIESVYRTNGQYLNNQLDKEMKKLNGDTTFDKISGIRKLMNNFPPYSHEGIDDGLSASQWKENYFPELRINSNPRIPRSQFFRRSSSSQKLRASNRKNLQKRFNTNIQMLDPKSILNMSPSSYPGVMATSPGVNNMPLAKLDPSLNTAAATTSTNENLQNLQNILALNSQTLAGNEELQRLKNALPSCSSNYNELKPNDRNLTEVLERVLSELQLLKECSAASETPEGVPCNLTGTWNSEIMGIRFEICESKSATKLDISVKDKYPPRRNAIMDKNWKCTGSTIKPIGGPFHLEAQKGNTLATFAGLCKKCGQVDTIFGSWTFVHPAKDCHGMQTAIEIKRDIFRRDLFEEKKKARQQKQSAGNQKCPKS